MQARAVLAGEVDVARRQAEQLRVPEAVGMPGRREELALLEARAQGFEGPESAGERQRRQGEAQQAGRRRLAGVVGGGEIGGREVDGGDLVGFGGCGVVGGGVGGHLVGATGVRSWLFPID
ncbi:MAG: hypothetical protein AAF772_03755 [Acidobacteriota bacterium]